MFRPLFGLGTHQFRSTDEAFDKKNVNFVYKMFSLLDIFVCVQNSLSDLFEKSRNVKIIDRILSECTDCSNIYLDVVLQHSYKIKFVS